MRLFHAPARGATPAGRCCKDGTGNFNPRPPRGGRRYVSYGPRPRHRFQSTPPARGATTASALAVFDVLIISIHAPREGGDGGGDVPIIHKGNFNPRPPRGGRRIPAADLSACRPFQSTPPARGATLLEVNKMVKIRIISIHAPREGGDSVKCRSSASSSNNFNPRPPRGGRRNDHLSC